MQYLVSVIDDGQAAAAGDVYSATPEEAERVDAFNDKLQAGGHWVFAGGLGLPDTATVLDTRNGAHIVTDGPFTETREFVAGLWIWEAADLDEALALAAEASTACGRRIEVRPILRPEDMGH